MCQLKCFGKINKDKDINSKNVWNKGNKLKTSENTGMLK